MIGFGAPAPSSPVEVAAARIAIGREIVQLRARLAETDLGHEATRISGELRRRHETEFKAR
jgi:hypothetical protein